jgi:hypothetical protein
MLEKDSKAGSGSVNSNLQKEREEIKKRLRAKIKAARK